MLGIRHILHRLGISEDWTLVLALKAVHVTWGNLPFLIVTEYLLCTYHLSNVENKTGNTENI